MENPAMFSELLDEWKRVSGLTWDLKY